MWYAAVAFILPSAAALLCAAAAHFGRSRRDNVLFYFFQQADVGHPGIVSVVTTMGFSCVAVLGLLLALVTPSDRAMLNLTWLGTALLFGVLAFDNVLHLHDEIPGGEKTAHVVYWAAFAAVAYRLRPVLLGVRGRGMLLAGLALLAASEAIDMFSRSDDYNYRFHEELSLAEETFACVGAWSCVAAAVGVASMLVIQAGVDAGDGNR